MNITANPARGWFALSREYPAALAATRMSPACFAVVNVVISRSFCLPTPQPISTVNRHAVGQLLPNFARDTLGDATTELIRRKIIYTDGPERTGAYALNPNLSEWEGLDENVFQMLRQPYAHLSKADAKPLPEPQTSTSETPNGSLAPVNAEKTPRFSPETVITGNPSRRKLRPKAEKTPTQVGENSAFLDGLREERREDSPQAPLTPGAISGRMEDAPPAQKAASGTARKAEPERPSPATSTGQPDQDKHDDSNFRWCIRAGIAALYLDGEFPEDQCVAAAAALANAQIQAKGKIDGESFANAIDGTLRFHSLQTSRGGEGVRDLVAVVLSSYAGQSDGSGRFQPHFPGVRWSAWVQQRQANELPLAPRDPAELPEWRRARQKAEFEQRLRELKAEASRKARRRELEDAARATDAAQAAAEAPERQARQAAAARQLDQDYAEAVQALSHFSARELGTAAKTHIGSRLTPFLQWLADRPDAPPSKSGVAAAAAPVLIKLAQAMAERVPP